MSRFWVGADPGGENNFGLAFLDAAGMPLDCATVSSVDEAVEKIVQKGAPLALGIDAPMWWTAREKGWRKADERLRDKYSDVSESVLSINSLRGAALVGGMMLALRIWETFPDTRITETHPKVLLYALEPALELERRESSFFERFDIPTDCWRDEHQRDATIGAVCAREGFEGRWTFDLARHCHDSEQDPSSYCLAPMHYFWPESLLLFEREYTK